MSYIYRDGRIVKENTIKNAVQQELNSQLKDENISEKFDSIKEIAEYLSKNPVELPQNVETGFVPGEGSGSVIQKDSESRGCEATGDYSLAGGVHAKATGLGSLAFGRYVSASGRAAMALGGALLPYYITGEANTTIYTTTIPNDFVGLVDGLLLVSTDNLLGNNSIQAIIKSTEVGESGLTVTLDKTFSTTAVTKLRIYLKGCSAVGISSLAEGCSTATYGAGSHAEGRATVAKGDYSHAEGLNTITKGKNSHSEGDFTKAEGLTSHAEGRRTTALGYASHAEGHFTKAEGDISHTEGYYTKAKGYASHAEGGSLQNIYLTGNNKIYTISKGVIFQNTFYLPQNILNLNIIEIDSGEAIAKIVNVNIEEDGYTITIELDTDLGELSHKQFCIPINIAAQDYSHTESFGSSYGEASHAGGWSSAKGDNSFSHGDQSVASGKTSTVFGTNNYSQNNSEFALGRSNRSHNGETDADKTLFSVGCGTFNEIGMDTRIANKIPLLTPEDGTNALEIMQNGDIWLGTYNEGHKIWDNVNKRVCNAWSVLDPFNGHEYVDLGLQSGTLWATSIIKNKLGEPLYFQWGDIEGWTAEQINNGEKAFDNSDYKWFDPLTDTYTKYNTTDGKTILDLEDDAVHVYMGGEWHMPTKEQLEELIANTTYTRTTQNGVNGMLFTSKTNGESVLVPVFGGVSNNSISNVNSNGHAWSSSVYKDNLSGAWNLTVYGSGRDIRGIGRASGRCVLGVINLKS